jgi:hypothetical protein
VTQIVYLIENPPDRKPPPEGNRLPAFATELAAYAAAGRIAITAGAVGEMDVVAVPVIGQLVDTTDIPEPPSWLVGPVRPGHNGDSEGATDPRYLYVNRLHSMGKLGSMIADGRPAEDDPVLAAYVAALINADLARRGRVGEVTS